MYHKRGLWAIKAKNGGVFPRHDAQPKAPAPAAKAPKFYPADDVKKPLVNKRKPKPTKLRFLLWLSLFFFFFFFGFLWLFCLLGIWVFWVIVWELRKCGIFFYFMFRCVFEFVLVVG